MAKQISRGKKWYVIHTYSGYEEQVRDALLQRIDSLDMKEHIFDIVVPTKKTVKVKNGKRKTVIEKIFPGYVMVQMEISDASWYVVRNTPNVTGFLGSGTTPVPMNDKEAETILKQMKAEEPSYQVELEIGQNVLIADGPFKNFEGKIIEIDTQKGKVKVLCSMFGRETPVELDFLQVKEV